MKDRSLFCLAGLAIAAIGFSQEAPIPVQKVKLTKIEIPEAIGRARKVGRTDANRKLSVTISLPFRDAAGAQAFADSVSDPSSSNFRNFITPEEVGQRFGATDAQVQGITAWMKNQGFTITMVSKNHLTVTGSCTAKQAETAFSTEIDDFQFDTLDPLLGNQKFFSYTAPLQVPSTIANSVLAVSGMQSYTKPNPLLCLTPTQTRLLYGAAPIYGANFRGQGRTVAIANWDGFRLSNVPLFYTKYLLPTPAAGVGTNVKVISVGGADGTTLPPEGEGDLDIQMVLGQAPLCNFLIYDNAGVFDHVSTLAKMAQDNLADVISESWEWRLPDSEATSAHQLHLSMTAQGITYMEASGDFGAGTGLGRGANKFYYPHEDPEVLSIGGTVAKTDAVGNRVSEVGWNGSGGGWIPDTRSFNIRPSWQKGNGVLTTVNHRLCPDVALQGGFDGNQGAYFFYLNGALNNQFAGTSFSCPVFAGQLAIAEQRTISKGGLPTNGAGKQRVGRLSDLIYRQNGRADVWHDITVGNNGVLLDGTPSVCKGGWDTVTGWGCINWDKMDLTTIIKLDLAPTFVANVEGSPVSSANNFTSNVNSLDGLYYQVRPATIAGLGQAASSSFRFNLPITVPRAALQEVDLKFTGRFAAGSTGQLFMLNWTTGKWDVLKSYAVSSTPTTATAVIKANFTTYVSGAGEFRILSRGLMPSTVGVTGNSYDTDLLSASVLYLPGL